MQSRRYLFALGLVLQLIPLSTARGQCNDNRGPNLIVGQSEPLLNGPYYSICAFVQPFLLSEFTVWGRIPDGGGEGVEFNLEFSSNIFPIARSVVYSGATELGSLADDSWQLQFAGCEEESGHAFDQLVKYSFFIVDFNPGWICISSPTQDEPVWQTCDQGEIAAGRFPVGCPNFQDGCFPVNPWFNCPIPTAQSSWSAIKSRY